MLALACPVTRYGVIELELLGVVWAVQECHLFLAGTLFQVVTDHRSLVPILNSYSLAQIENPRLQRLVLKLRSYQLHASWCKGADNAAADALSRNPIQNPVPGDEIGEDSDLHSQGIRACIRSGCFDAAVNLRYSELLAVAKDDPDYQTLLAVIRAGFPSRHRDVCPAARPYRTFREHLSVADGLVLKGPRVVVPCALRPCVLSDLHAAHQGLTCSKARARQVVYWPHLSRDIDDLVRACPDCRLYSASLPKEPLLVSDVCHPTVPFASTSADLFSCQ